MIIKTDLASLAGRFEKPKAHGNGYLVCCPCHEDRTPSLSLSLCKSGKLLFHCHAGCSQEQVAEAIQKIAPEAFRSSRRKVSLGPPPSTALMPVPAEHCSYDLRVGASHYSQPTYRLTTWWEYRDQDGRLLQLTCRYDEALTEGAGPKPRKMILPYCFFANEGWRFRGSGEKNTLIYGLDRLAKRPDAKVLLVEGEKTADAAALIFPSYVVLSWLGGSKRIPRVDWGPLKGKEVTYWPDADEAGKETVGHMVDSLREAGAASVRIVEVPGNMPLGWDLADHVPPDVEIEALLKDASSQRWDAIQLFQRLSLEQLIERVVFNSGTERFVDTVTGRHFAASQIDSLFRRQEKYKKSRISVALLEHGSFQTVMNYAYLPGDTRRVITDQAGMSVLNFWRPGPVIRQAGDASVFVDHLRYLCPTDLEFQWLADTLAYMFQQPGKKLHFAPVLVGRQGTGKSYLATTMTKLFGKHNCTTATASEIQSQFNGWVAEKQFVVVEEVMALGRREIMNALKPLITEEHLTVNTKYERTYVLENTANFLFLSNHRDALRLDEDDRRYFVIDNSETPKREQDYYEALYRWTLEHLGIILDWLLNRDLSHFNPNQAPPMTDGKQRMIEASKPESERLVQEMLEVREAPFDVDLVEVKVAHQAIFGFSGSGYGCRISQPAFQQLLKKLGGENLKQRKGSSGERLSLWAVRNAHFYRDLSGPATIDAYMAQRAGAVRSN